MRKWPLALLFMSSAAWALKPAKHRALAEAACMEARLPDAFCYRMGKQVYETDYEEWDQLSAHAQRERGQDRCAAADAALARLDQLGRAVVADAHAQRFEQAAIDLGRALHTLQDECAHHGMTNEEHAFYSLEQTCTGEQVSPDVQPAALTCAQARTRDAMTVVAAALADVSWSGVESICVDYDNRDTCTQAVLPTPIQVCDFLALYHEWDGGDSTWDGTRVGPALAAGFAAAVAGEPATSSICAGDTHAIDPISPHATVVDRDAGCVLTDITCLGKVDEDGEPMRKPVDVGGCAAGGAPGALIALGLLVLSRRRLRTQLH